MSCDPNSKKKSPHQPPQPKAGLRPGGAEKGVSRSELELLRQKAADLAAKKPEKAAIILSDWLNGRSLPADGRRSKPKKAG